MHFAEALTKVGLIGVKVWICKGEVYGKRVIYLQILEQKEKEKHDKKKGKKKRENK